MKKETLVLVLVLVLCSVLIGVAAGCGDTSVKGPVPIMGTVGTNPEGPQVTYNKDTCNTEADCRADELCTIDPAATKAVGYTIQVCVKGCDAELETVETEIENVDGTSFVSSEVLKVDGTDTCQRDGDVTVYCDLANHVCKEYEEVDPTEPTSEPTEPTEPTPTEETSFAMVRCCYDGDTTGLYGQIAWSTSKASDPEAWASASDLMFDWKGCFDTYVDLDNVSIGFWVDVTTGIAEENQWKGSSLKPSGCSVGHVLSAVGKFEQGAGWQFYDAAD